MSQHKPPIFWSSNALQLLAKLVQAVLIARLAGATSMGVYVAAVAIPLVLIRIVELGLSQSLGYFTRFDTRFFGHALRILFFHLAATAGPVLICIFFLRYYSFGDNDVNLLVRASMVLIVVSVMAQLFNGILTPMLVATEHGKGYAFITIAPSILFTLILVLIHAFQRRVGPDILILCDMLSNGVTALLVALILRSHISETSTGLPRSAEVYTYALQAYPGILSKVIVLRLDRIVLAALLPPASLALYSIASSLRDLALTPSNIFSVTFQNRLVDQAKQGEDYRGTALRAMSLWLLLFAVGNLVFWFSSPYLLPLVYGHAFSMAVPVARILMISTLFISVAGFSWMVMVALRRPALISFSNVVGGAFSIALLWLLARNYGIIGAAWSTVISSAIIMVVASAISFSLKRPLALVKPAL